MIKAKDVVKDFIKAQPTLESFAKKIGTTRQTLHNILNDENVSSEIIAKILNETGMDFEKAFMVKED